MTPRRLAYLHIDSGSFGWQAPPPAWMIDAMRPTVAACLEEPDAPQALPAMRRWRVSARANGRRAALFSLRRGLARVAGVGVAGSSRAGAGLWRVMCEGLRRERAAVPPPAPWCALRLLAGGAQLSLDEIDDLDQIAPTLAWTFLSPSRDGARDGA